MGYFEIIGGSSKHFCFIGEIVYFTGYEYRDHKDLFLMVINNNGLKQLIKRSDLRPVPAPSLNSNELIKRYYETIY